MVLNKSLKTKLDSVNRLEINYRLSALPKNLIGLVVQGAKTVVVRGKNRILTPNRKKPEMTVPISYFNLCRTYGLNAGYYMVGIDVNRQGAVNGFVDRLYGYCLGRSGDQGGQQNWVTQLINGSATGAQVAYGFFFSPEFMNNNYSNEVFVTILYNVCLNRAPDPDGLNNWVTALDNGADRLEVFRGFAHSDEFTGICNSYGIVRGSI